MKNILHLLTGVTEPVSVGTIESNLEKRVPRRTLQRQLAKLVANGRLVREGKGRATTYRLANTETKQAVPGNVRQDTREYLSFLPLCEQSQELLSYVSKPMGARKPVAFDRQFLDAYVPNNTYYLEESIRKRLRSLGETEDTSLPAGTYGRQILDRLLIDLSFASSRLEGNTYSLLDTERLVAEGVPAEGKAAEETQMILNHKLAVEMLVEQAWELRFNLYTVLNLHGVLSDNLLPDPSASGAIRRRAVLIGGSVYQPTEVPQAIDEMFGRLLRKADAIKDPFEQAFFVMVQIPYLQPFEDVNKRVARMAANIPLIKENLCPLTFLDVPTQAYMDGTLAVYELQRVDLLKDVFVWAYERSTQKYMQVKKTMAAPEPIRLLYRSEIYELVRELVVTRTTAYTARVDELAMTIPEKDREDFRSITLEEIKRLHKGIIARYRIRPSEFEAWRAARGLG